MPFYHDIPIFTALKTSQILELRMLKGGQNLLKDQKINLIQLNVVVY